MSEDKLLKNTRDFVAPGDKLVESMEFLPGKNCFREGNGVFAKRLGLVSVQGRVLSVIPLNGVYMPNRDDMVIGEVTDVQSNGWVIDIQCPYQAYLPLSGVRGYIDSNKTDISKIYGVGDVIYGKIKMVNSMMSVHISMFDRICRKFSGGRVIRVNPAKVPRIIGKSGSMIDMIKSRTGCYVVVGQNGTIWLEGDKESFVIDVIRYIEENSASEGLTNKIEEILKRGVVHEKK
ncbi:MAG: RNA-binding protein [Candidatus Aenigmarchaeota archaeon]|nr:RNA-binding protein [Candidatus Aenigmarchaeota archaeon]